MRTPLRTMRALGYPLAPRGTLDADGNLVPRWLDDLDVVADGPRTSVPNPSGSAARHQALHVGRDDEGKLWLLTGTRSQFSPDANVQKQGPYADLARLARDMSERALITDWGPAVGPPLAHAERIARAIEQHPNNPCGFDSEALASETRIELAVSRFLDVHRRLGSHRYRSRTDLQDPSAYMGPLFWKEADARFRFALELEREFPGQVHLDGLLAASTTTGWDPEIDGKVQHVDVLVADHLGFTEGPGAARRFQEAPAGLLVEVKFLPKGRWGMQLGRELEAIDADIERLARHLALGRAKAAAMLVVDDTDAYAHRRNVSLWMHGVRLILARRPSAKLTPELAAPFPWGLGTQLDVDLVDSQRELAHLEDAANGKLALRMAPT